MGSMGYANKYSDIFVREYCRDLFSSRGTRSASEVAFVPIAELEEILECRSRELPGRSEKDCKCFER